MIQSIWNYLNKTENENTNLYKAIILIRIIIGSVFLSEGIQKFLFVDALGVGRFIKIGIPAPSIMAPFVGIVEMVFGGFIIFGLYTRFASIPLIIDISVAIITTKIPMLFHDGFWKTAHEARVDGSMFLGLIFLLIVGSGRWSLDELRGRKKMLSKIASSLQTSFLFTSGLS